MVKKIVSECQTTILVKKRLKLSSNGSNNLVDIICQPYVMYDSNIYLPPYLCTSLKYFLQLIQNITSNCINIFKDLFPRFCRPFYIDKIDDSDFQEFVSDDIDLDCTVYRTYAWEKTCTKNNGKWFLAVLAQKQSIQWSIQWGKA